MVADASKKYGRPNEETPAKWQKDYKDFNAPLENGTSVSAKIEAEASIPPTPRTAADTEPADVGLKESPLKQPKSEPVDEEGDSKKRKRHEGETSEERAERKRKKKEKKEKRKSKKEDSDDGSD